MATINLDINTGSGVQNLRDMKRELTDLRGQMAQAEGEEFIKLSQRASELNADMQRVNSTITSSGSAFTNFNTLLGRTAKSLLTLDFAQAAEQAQALQNVASKMTFKELTGGLKQATTAFKGLGKAILTNPLFLIAAVVIAVGVAFYKLMEELGLLQPILDMIGKYFDLLLMPIKLLIQGLKDLTDWFGWTSHAADAEAEVQEKAAERRAAANRRANIEIENNLNNEIRLLKLQGAAIEDIEDKELELAKTRFKTFADENRANIARLKSKALMNRASDEELDLLQKLQLEYDNLAKNIEFTAMEIANRRKERLGKEVEENKKTLEKAAAERKSIEEKSAKFIQDLNRQEELANIQLIDDQIEREQKLTLKKLKHKNEDVKSSKMTAEAKAKWTKWYEDEVDRINAEAKKKQEQKEEDELAANDLFNQKIMHQKEMFELEKQLIEAENIENEFERAEELDRIKHEMEEEKFQQEMAELQRRLDTEEITRDEYRLAREKAELDHQKRLDKINESEKKRQKALADLDKNIVASKAQAIGAIGQLASENERSAKAFALAQIATDFGVSLMSSIKTAQIAAAAAGPGGPAVFPAVLAQMLGPTLAAFAQAKQVVTSGGSGGGAPTPSMGGGMAVSNMTQQPSFSNFRDDFAGDIQMGGGSSLSGTFILDSELSDNEERKNKLNLKKNF